MITNSHRQSIFHFPPQFRKKTACCFIVGIALLGAFLSASAQGATFTVNSPSDVVGAAPLNDGICATTYKNGVPNGEPVRCVRPLKRPMPWEGPTRLSTAKHLPPDPCHPTHYLEQSYDYGRRSIEHHHRR